MSRALARLRDVLGDPLLVRTRHGYVPTTRAQVIQPRLAAAIRHLRGVFEPPGFDPADARRVLRLAASDVQTVLLVPGLMRRLAREAPGMDLRVEPYGADLAARLESGALDLAFALSSTPLPPGAYSEIVGEDRLALVMRRGHPAAGRDWSIGDYGIWPQVGVALLGDGQSEIDALLAAAGISRRLGLVTPHFMAALAAVAATDLVTTLSATLAARFARTFGLVQRPPPFAETRLRTTLVCAHIHAADPALTWFRQVVRDVAREVEAEAGTGAETGQASSPPQAPPHGI